MQQWLLVFFLVILFSEANAQGGWNVVDPFEQTCFVENAGQINQINDVNEPVLYHAKRGGINYYFSKTSLYISKKVHTKRTEEELEEIAKTISSFQSCESEDFKEKMEYEIHDKSIAFQWKNTSASCKVRGEKKVNYYFSFAGPGLKNGNATIHASAYENIVYENIYNGIDLVFRIPKDSTGIKYYFITRKGANISDIKLQLPEGCEAAIVNNHVEINSPFGKITDHAPVSYLANGKKKIRSQYELKENILSFKISHSTFRSDIIIDPWLVVPSFAVGNSAFDVDYDGNGNVYAYGGMMNDFSLLKYNTTGSLQWVYTPVFSSLYKYYGDFAIDRASNRIYLVEGFNVAAGAGVIKINSAAVLEASFAGHPQFIEMWRIAFSRCSNQAVIAGGGTSYPTYQTCYLDTSLSSLVPVQFVPTNNCCHDVGVLALDDLGNAYEMTNQNIYNFFNNMLVKLPLPTMMPTQYAVSSGYNFFEAFSVMYYNGVSENSNGYNGLSTSGELVFSYDGYALKKWDGHTGNLLTYKRIHYPVNGDSSTVYWGGITSDNCGNLFLGDSVTVRQYDTAFNFINSYTMPGVITDVMFSNDGNLYVSGVGFVTSFVPTLTIACNNSSLDVNVTVNNATCTTPGTASITITGGIGPYDIVWNTAPPQTGASVTNLPPGTYMVTVSEKSCFQGTVTETFNIDTTAGAFVPVYDLYPDCVAGSVTHVDVDIIGGQGPFTYSWSNGAGNTDSVASLAPGTYTVNITDMNNCVGSITISINPFTAITHLLNTPIFCSTDTSTVSISINGGTPPYTVNWTQPYVHTGLAIHGVNAGAYAGTITDYYGCTHVFNENIGINPTLVVTASSPSACDGDSVNIVLTVTGGTSPYTYSWVYDPFNTTNVLNGVGPGSYIYTVTDAAGCSVTQTEVIGTNSPIVITATTTPTCFGGFSGSAQLQVSGGIPPFNYVYSWSGIPSETSNAINNVGAGTYNVTVTSGPCSETYSFSIETLPPTDSLYVVATYCTNDAAAEVFFGQAGTATTYQWTINGVLIPGATSSSYISTINDLNQIGLIWTNSNGCVYTTNSLQVIEFSSAFTASTAVNVFSPDGDEINDVFYPFKELLLLPFDKYELVVFDRWGVELFGTVHSTEGWNGKTGSKQKEVPEGVYYWILHLFNECSQTTEEITGFVHLMR